MKNPLEQLRKDMTQAWYRAPTFSSAREDAFALLDTFISEWEAVEVFHCAAQGAMTETWHNAENTGVRQENRFQILVLRTQKPTLLEAAKELLDTWYGSEFHTGIANAVEALSTAISKEQSE